MLRCGGTLGAMQTLRIGPGVPTSPREPGTIADLCRGLLAGTAIGVGLTIGNWLGSLLS